MRSTERIPWLRICAESIAIVASILLAFALDAWWDGRAAAQSERRLLVTLSEELTAARTILQRQLEIYDVLVDATQAVADRLVDAGGGESVRIRATYLGALLYNMTYDPPMGTTNLLLGSDQSAVIRSTELRAALAEWPAIIQDAVEEQTALWRISDSEFEPVLHEAVANMAEAYEARAMWEKSRSVSLSGSDREMTVISSQRLWNMLYQRLTYLQGARNELEGADDHLQSIIGLISASLSM